MSRLEELRVEIADTQTKITMARNYLARVQDRFDKVTISLMSQSLDEQQSELDRLICRIEQEFPQ